MKLAVLLVVLGLVATGHALKCYSCKSKKTMADVSVAAAVLTLLGDSPPCTEFDPSEPATKFEKECPLANSKACMKVTDPKDSKNQMRGCFPTANTVCEGASCHCTSDLCNGSERGWPSAVLLLAALVAALVGGR